MSHGTSGRALSPNVDDIGPMARPANRQLPLLGFRAALISGYVPSLDTTRITATKKSPLIRALTLHQWSGAPPLAGVVRTQTGPR